MKTKEFQKELQFIVNKCGLDSELNMPDYVITDYLIDSLTALMKVNKCKPKDDETNDFIERMYKIYPPHCPKRNTSLGKTKKDKDRIKKLLKHYSMDEIERVINNEIDTKYGKTYMQNFSTFLNNFPDPTQMANTLFDDIEQLSKVEQPNHIQQLNIGGVIYK